jgi:predicted cupin superfamily sugar epimerase
MPSTVTSTLVEQLHRGVPSAAEMIERLGLAPHPEGGHYRETWRGGDRGGGRSVGTAIVFLLTAGERSHWHRVDADEVWLHHDGDPLVLAIADGVGTVSDVVLGSAAQGATPQAVVPAGAWQSAWPDPAAVAGGAVPAVAGVGWTLVSCVVAPGFEFDGFALAPAGWWPPGWTSERDDRT